MEYRKNYTPRDMVDDTLLTQLLTENESDLGQYNTDFHRQNAPSCGCRSRQMNRTCRTQISEPKPGQKDLSCNDETFSNCSCDEQQSCARKECLSSYPLAMAYVPEQEWENLYNMEEALLYGTIFKSLSFPFYPACKSCK